MRGVTQTELPNGEGVAIERQYAGTIILRPLTDEPPEFQYRGDKPCDYFIVPANTTHLHGRLTWDSPQEMELELWSPEDKRHTSAKFPFVTATSPAEVTIDSPPHGEWSYWLGPGFGGANIPWKLTLTWTIARANATATEVMQSEKTDLPCAGSDG